MNIRTNKFVALAYDLNVGENEERELMERATDKQPLCFIFGSGLMLPAFERELEGLTAGDSFCFSVSPEEAFGEYDEENVLELPRNLFEVDGRFDDEVVKEGAIIPMMDSEGQQRNGSVLEIRDGIVLMDFNHPLAGETLHFKGHVVDVHEPTSEEIAEHGGCGCDVCENDCGENAEGCNCNR